MIIVCNYDVLLDMDTGLLKFIIQNNIDTHYYNEENLTRYKNKYALAYNLKDRKDFNPLSIIIKNEYKELQDKLYNSYFDKYYNKILRNSSLFYTVNFIKALNNNPRYIIYFLCPNQKIKITINKIFNNCNAISNISEIKKYDTLFVKSLDFFDRNDIEIEGKNIYISNGQYNFFDINKAEIKKKYLYLLLSNVLKIVDLYNLKDPVG